MRNSRSNQDMTSYRDETGENGSGDYWAYGPGIVDRLKSKFINMSMNQAQSVYQHQNSTGNSSSTCVSHGVNGCSKRNGSTLRSCTSLENLQDSSSGPLRNSSISATHKLLMTSPANMRDPKKMVAKSPSMEALLDSRNDDHLFICSSPSLHEITPRNCHPSSKHTPVSSSSSVSNSPSKFTSSNSNLNCPCNAVEPSVLNTSSDQRIIAVSACPCMKHGPSLHVTAQDLTQHPGMNTTSNNGNTNNNKVIKNNLKNSSLDIIDHPAYSSPSVPAATEPMVAYCSPHSHTPYPIVPSTPALNGRHNCATTRPPIPSYTCCTQPPQPAPSSESVSPSTRVTSNSLNNVLESELPRRDIVRKYKSFFEQTSQLEKQNGIVSSQSGSNTTLAANSPSTLYISNNSGDSQQNLQNIGLTNGGSHHANQQSPTSNNSNQPKGILKNKNSPSKRPVANIKPLRKEPQTLFDANGQKDHTTLKNDAKITPNDQEDAKDDKLNDDDLNGSQPAVCEHRTLMNEINISANISASTGPTSTPQRVPSLNQSSVRSSSLDSESNSSRAHSVQAAAVSPTVRNCNCEPRKYCSYSMTENICASSSCDTPMSDQKPAFTSPVNNLKKTAEVPPTIPVSPTTTSPTPKGLPAVSQTPKAAAVPPVVQTTLLVRARAPSPLLLSENNSRLASHHVNININIQNSQTTSAKVSTSCSITSALSPQSSFQTHQGNSMVFDFRNRNDVKPHIAIIPNSSPSRVYPGDHVDNRDGDPCGSDPEEPMAMSGLKFIGENVIVGRSCLIATRNKNLSIRFDDGNLSSLFEYEAEEEEDAHQTPEDQDGTASGVGLPSAVLGNYKPGALHEDRFELGVLPIRRNPGSDGGSSNGYGDAEDDQLMATPAASTSTYSEFSSSDLLF